MGTWGVKTFENDGASDWIYALEESTSAEFLFAPLREVVRCRGKADLDASLETLAAAEVIVAARHDPPKGVPSEARKWICRIGFSPGDRLIGLACKAVEKVRTRSELADKWRASKDCRAWDSDVAGLVRRLKQAQRLPQPMRTARKVIVRQTLAELILEVSKTRSARLRAELNVKLAKLKDINRPVGGKGLNSLTPLHWLASRGLVQEVEMLVQRGAKIDVELPVMARPIGFAIENNQRLMIQCLLELGADAAYAFDYAVKSNRPVLVEMIYAHGVELQKKGTMDRTAAHSAALSGADRSLALLARLGADLEARDEEDDTPLHYAAMFGELRAVKKLLELKVDVNPVDSEGKTPLDFAIEDNYRSVANALKTKGGKAGPAPAPPTKKAAK